MWLLFVICCVVRVIFHFLFWSLSVEKEESIFHWKCWLPPLLCEPPPCTIIHCLCLFLPFIPLPSLLATNQPVGVMVDMTPSVYAVCIGEDVWMMMILAVCVPQHDWWFVVFFDFADSQIHSLFRALILKIVRMCELFGGVMAKPFERPSIFMITPPSLSVEVLWERDERVWLHWEQSLIWWISHLFFLCTKHWPYASSIIRFCGVQCGVLFLQSFWPSL